MQIRLRRTGHVPATTTLLVLALLVAAPRPASASCAEMPPLDRAIANSPIVFVGTVTAIQDGFLAQFTVEEIWAGGDLREVTVQTGEGPGTVSSVDRSFEVGERYLVLPHADGARLRDNSCSATQPWTDELAAFRPVDARTVEADAGPSVDGSPSGGGDGIPMGLAVLAAGILLVGGIGAAVIRRSR